MQRSVFFSLLVTEPPELAGTVFPIRRDLTTIGRDPACEIVFDNSHVSKRHAELVVRERRVYLRDAGSTNGTYLNEEEVFGYPEPDGELDPASITSASTLNVESGRGRQVRLGDLIRVGEVSSRVIIDDQSDEQVGQSDEQVGFGDRDSATGLEDRPLNDPALNEIAWAEDVTTWADDDPAMAVIESHHRDSPDDLAAPGDATPLDEAPEPPVNDVVLDDSALPDVIAPAPRSKTILVSHARADRGQAELIVRYLQKKGHKAWIDRSGRGDGWSGRLLDVMWSCDAAVFVVSRDAAGSARVHREIHLAGSERVPILSVLVDDDPSLPVDLAHYLDKRTPIRVVDDPTAGLEDLGARIDDLPRRLVARPKLRIAQVIAVALVVVAIWFALRFVGIL